MTREYTDHDGIALDAFISMTRAIRARLNEAPCRFLKPCGPMVGTLAEDIRAIIDTTVESPAVQDALGERLSHG